MRGNAKSTIRLGSRLAPQLAIAAVLLAICGFAAPAAIAAEGERIIEPELSLTGGCGTTVVDPVPDPGPCPLESEGGPGVPGFDHPPATFADPRGVAIDPLGNIYVSSFGSAMNGSKGRIDIFCSDGTFISELVVAGPSSMAIDSEGYLYTFSPSQGKVLRFKPDTGYNPGACEIEYGETAPVTVRESGSLYSGMALNRDDDHLFVNFGTGGVIEFKSAAEGNEIVRTTKAEKTFGAGNGMAIDVERDRMYASAGSTESQIDIFDLTSVVGTPPNDEYEKIGSIVESSVPAEEFGTQLAVAVDEGNGNVFLLDGENCTLYEFEEDGTYVQTIAAAFLLCENTAKQIAVDNGATSPNGKPSEEDEEGRFLYVPSNRTAIGHSYAFFLSVVGPPVIDSTATANVSEDEAELRAVIDPNNLETTYAFEYKVEGAASWTPAGGGTIPAGGEGVAVSAPATGLAPGTKYVFRVSASNEAADPVNGGQDEAEGSFSTFPSVSTEPEPCANSLLRTGLSALLPDCRAYELVTPADTNGRAPIGVGRLGGVFTTRQVSPAGDKVGFRVEGGSLPGLGGTGSLVGDPYLATRTAAGWSTAYTGPSGEEASQIVPGARSPDQGYFFYFAGDKGSAVLVPKGNTGYVHYPDGHAELLGQGSLESIDPEAVGRLISEGGTHIVFSTGNLTGAPVQLEPDAAPSGTRAIYDRTPDGTTHVVSLKPGGAPFGAGENAGYLGASLDGIGIAFKVGTTLYLRYDNEETFAIGTGVDFAGVAEGGRRIFYVQGGDLKAFDVEAGVIDFTTTGDVIPVTVSAGGTAAYFVSETAIAESGPNPEGAEPQAGEQNLYRSVEGQVDFVATVTERDVEGEYNGIEIADGLGLWVSAIGEPLPGLLGNIPARSTPDGSAFLFKSRAALGDFDPEGHAQIYRYAPGELQCLSCNPTGAAAASDATLQTDFREGSAELFAPVGWPENLRADGRRAFFETSEALVVGDSDGLRDVYEWEDQGVGSCKLPGGCVYLISSPQSRRNEYLWAVSPSGEDVFFLSSDLLVGSDADGTPSIYDARAGGGFLEAAQQGECQGEGCRPNLTPPPPQPAPLTPVSGPGDQAKPAKRCPKGKHKVKKGGKVRCVKNKKKKSQKKGAKKNRAGAGKKGGSR